MSSLVFLEIDSSLVSGTLPEDWGSPSVSNQLAGLKLTNCNISGDPHYAWNGVLWAYSQNQ